MELGVLARQQSAPHLAKPPKNVSCIFTIRRDALFPLCCAMRFKDEDHKNGVMLSPLRECHDAIG
jgi:hypothetical protein